MVSEQKRSFVRGDFSFNVKFRTITPEEYETIKGTGHQILSPGKKNLIIDRNDTDNRDNNITTNTYIVDLLVHMDEKLDRTLSILSKGEADNEFFNHEGIGINISGSGMKIGADRPFESGQIIHSNLALSRFPLVDIDVFGKVIRVTPMEEDGKTTYHLGIEFLDLKENDREKIISCVFQRQRATIREKKSEG